MNALIPQIPREEMIPGESLTLLPTSFEEMQKLAAAVAASKMFGMQTPEQALVLMALCRSEGKDPIQAVRQYHIINGRPALRADAMLAEFQARGGTVAWGERTNERVSATFRHSAGGEVLITWTLEDAKRAGLTGNPTWNKFPRQMLTARVISEGVRTVLPGVVAGIYTPEEVEAFAPAASTLAAPAVAPADSCSDPLTLQVALDEFRDMAVPSLLSAQEAKSARALARAAGSVLGEGARELNWRSPGPWIAAKAALLECALRTAAGEPELEDPFAEDEKGGA